MLNSSAGDKNGCAFVKNGRVDNWNDWDLSKMVVPNVKMDGILCSTTAQMNRMEYTNGINKNRLLPDINLLKLPLSEYWLICQPCNITIA